MKDEDVRQKKLTSIKNICITNNEDIHIIFLKHFEEGYK